MFPIENKDIFDRCNMAEYIKIINLCSCQGLVFFISQHDLCFMYNRIIKNELVYRQKTLSFIFPWKTYLV